MIKAHRVLSDLEKYTPNYAQDKPKGVDDNYVSEAISRFKTLIRNSIKFKFGEFGDLEGLFSKKGRRKLYGYPGLFVNTNEDEQLHFPFDQCYFEFTGDHRIEGKLHYALLTDYDKGSDSFVLTMFQKCQATDNVWVLNKFSLIVEMGPPKPGAKSNLSVIRIWDSKRDLDNDGVVNKYFTLPLMFLTLGLAVLNCNNVYYKDTYPDRALQKKRARKGKKPLYEYKSLYVMPPGARYKSGPPKDLWTTRVNFRIGGWKYYPPPGLFGKYPGRFWFNGIARGDPSQGVVHKEYDVTRMV